MGCIRAASALNWKWARKMLPSQPLQALEGCGASEQLTRENGVVVVSILLGTSVTVKPDTNEDIPKDNRVTHFCPLKQ